MQPESARRYAGAAQLADDLRRWLDGLPIAAQPDTATYRMKKFVTRHRFAVGSASAVLLALIGGLGMALWQAKVAHDHALRADAQARRAEQQTAQAHAQVARTRKVKEFMVSVFLPADPMRRGADAPKTIEQAFDAALERARTELASDPVLQADVLDDFGEILSNQGRFDEAKPLFEQALAVAEKEYGPDHPAVAESLQNLSVVAFMTDHIPDAARHIARAVAILERDDGGDPLALPSALTNLAAVKMGQGDSQGVRDIADRTLRLFRERDPTDARMIPVLSNAASIALRNNELDQAQELLNEVVALIEHEYGADSPTLWSSLSTLAGVEYVRGNAREERAYTERALALARANFAGDHPWTASSLGALGFQRASMGEVDEGEALLRESVAMYERLGDSEAIASLRYLSIVQNKRDDKTASMESLTRAVALCERLNQTASLICVVTRANHAMSLARAGQGEAALRQAQAAARDLPDDPALYSERGQIMEARAAALAALGRREEALAEQDAVIALLRENFGSEHSETLRVEKSRARLEREDPAK